MLANVDSNLLALVMMSVHQNPLNQVVAVLVSSDVDERDTRAIGASSSDNTKIAIQEIKSTNLQALLNNFRRELVDAVVVRVCEDVVDDTTFVRR